VRTPVVVDLYDRPTVRKAARPGDGAIPHAVPGDATARPLTRRGDAGSTRFAATGKPISQTAAVIYGATPSITEASPVSAPAWFVEGADRAPVARAAGMLGVVIVASGLLRRRCRDSRAASRSPRTDAGRPDHARRASKHWSTVHAADLGRFLSGAVLAR